MFKHQQSTTQKESLKRIIELDTNSLITDFVYNHNGSKLAVADSQGNINIYQRNNQKFAKSAQFKADDAAIWKISWSDPNFGQLLAIASFKKKVAVFQNRNHKWIEIARHQLHQGSVNFVQWTPAAYGIKLYAAGSDGFVSILQVKKNNWQMWKFKAHQGSINSLAIKPVALNQSNSGLQMVYPTLSTISKDLVLKIWRHSTQSKFYKLQSPQQNSYCQVCSIKPHKQLTRVILFKPIWTDDQKSPSYSIITGSEDGHVKVTSFRKDKMETQIIVHQGNIPVVRLAQSLTGKHLSISVLSHNQEKSLLYTERQKDQWELVQTD